MTEESTPPAKPSSSKTWLMVLAVVLGGFVLPVGLYGWFAYSFWSNKPQVKRNFNAEMNAPISKIPQEQRAWPRYRAALLQLKPQLDRWKAEEFSPDSPSWPQILAFVQEHQAALTELRQAAELPHLGYLYGDRALPEDEPLERTDEVPPTEVSEPPSENPLLISVLLIPQQWLPKGTAFLIADMHRAAAAGQGDAVVANVKAILGIVKHLREPPLSVSQAASWNAFIPCCDAIGEVLLSHPNTLNEAQLAEVSGYLEEFSVSCVRLDFAHDRVVMSDIEQRRFTDDGYGDGYLYPEGEEGERLDPFTMAFLPLAQGSWKQKTASRKEHREKVDELFQLTEEDCVRPLWELEGSRAAKELNRLDDPRWTLVALMFPDLVSLYRDGQIAAMRADGTRLAIAMERYRRRHNAWPDSLDKLVPEFIAQIPVDRYSGQALRYKMVDGAPRIYSVYLDKVDDGGQPAPDTDPNATLAERIDSQRTDTGDLVLWPALKAKPNASGDPADVAPE